MSLVAQRIETLDPHTSVTLVHVACSGGKIDGVGHGSGVQHGGLLTPYQGAAPNEDPAFPQRPQLQQVRALIGDRKVDALVISVGGNDIGFSNIIMQCLIHPACYRHEPQAVSFAKWTWLIKSGWQLFDPLIRLLPGKMTRLAGCVGSKVTSACNSPLFKLGIDPSRVLITAYPDGTRGATSRPAARPARSACCTT